MKFKKLECTNCGATLEYDKEKLYCNFCGSKLLIDDEALNINYTYVKMDTARIKEVERKEKVRLRELELEEKEKKMVHKNNLYTTIGFIVFLLISYAILLIMAMMESPNADEIAIPLAAKEYVGEHYEQVEKELKNAGFSNIELIPQEDLINGWITKDGTVSRVSIGGDAAFSSGSVFSKDANVIITYRTLKVKDDKESDT